MNFKKRNGAIAGVCVLAVIGVVAFLLISSGHPVAIKPASGVLGIRTGAAATVSASAGATATALASPSAVSGSSAATAAATSSTGSTSGNQTPTPGASGCPASDFTGYASLAQSTFGLGDTVSVQATITNHSTVTCSTTYTAELKIINASGTTVFTQDEGPSGGSGWTAQKSFANTLTWNQTVSGQQAQAENYTAQITWPTPGVGTVNLHFSLTTNCSNSDFSARASMGTSFAPGSTVDVDALITNISTHNCVNSHNVSLEITDSSNHKFDTGLGISTTAALATRPSAQFTRCLDLESVLPWRCMRHAWGLHGHGILD